MITVSEPVLGTLEEELVLEVLRSGRLVRGPMIERFEHAVREKTGTRHAVAVNNGTSALIAALLAHGIGPGDEVVTTPFTFVATLNAILHVGATPRFVDIGDDFNIDPDLVEASIGPRTRALAPVHLYGCPAHMEPLEALARRHGLAIIEDGAQALGARVHGRAVGSFGTGCFSFYATKNITTGEGGAITTDDDDVAAALRILRDQGQRAPYDYDRPGFNFRMTELEAALGVAQMQRLDTLLERRHDHAIRLRHALADTPGLVLPVEPPQRRHVFHQFTVQVLPDARCDRDRLCAALRRHGVDSRVYYPRVVFDYDCFRSFASVERSALPRARAAATQVLSLPVHPSLDNDDLEHIARVTRGALT